MFPKSGIKKLVFRLEREKKTEIFIRIAYFDIANFIVWMDW